MGRFWKWAGIGLGGVAAVGLAGLLYVYIASESILSRRHPLMPSSLHASTNPQAIARGKRFAMAYGCTDCHGKNLQGAFIPDFGMTSRNLTRLARSFSDADFDHAVRNGLRPDGTSVAEYMPSDAFQFIPQVELADIVSYVRSLPPAGNDVPFPSFDLSARWRLLAGKKHTDQYWFAWQRPALDLGPRYARGRVLAMAACGECHTTSLRGFPDMGDGFKTPDLALVASYDRAGFTKFMRTGKAAGNRELKLMSATARVRFSHFTDDEISALYDYLAVRGRKLTNSGS